MWGELNDLSFWEAIRREPQHVPANERRAVMLLAAMCDPERVAFYLMHGLFFALGNVTGRTFCIRHCHGHSISVEELDDGQTRASWCIQPGDRSAPLTDHVLTVKNLIEGEEFLFRQIGNRMDVNRTFSDHHCDEGSMRNQFGDYFMSPHHTSFKEFNDIHEALRIQRLGVLAYRDEYFEHADPECVHELKTRRVHKQDGFLHVDRFPNDPLTMYERGVGAEIDFDDPNDQGVGVADCWVDAYREQNPVGYPGPRVEDRTAMTRFNQALRRGEDVFRSILDDGFLAEDGAVGYLQGFEDGIRTARPRPLLGDNLHGLEAREAAGRFNISAEEAAFCGGYAAGFNTNQTPTTGATTVLGFNPQTGFGQYPLAINTYPLAVQGRLEFNEAHGSITATHGCRSTTEEMKQLEYTIKYILMEGLEFIDKHDKFLKLADVEL